MSQWSVPSIVSQWKKHFEHLDVFARLRKAGLKLKLSKCDLLLDRIKYLGHIVSAKGLEVDPVKTKAIQEHNAPKNIKEVSSVIGMASYYRHFTANLSDLVETRKELTKKNVRYCWDVEHQHSFDLLKQKLCNAPVLAQPLLDRPYHLYTDASLHAVGAVLEQQFLQVSVSYNICQKLGNGQKKWQIIKKEEYAIIFAEYKLRHYLLGSEFTIYLDHNPLSSLFTSEMKNIS